MKAMILAAGLGTRLKPWTLEHPKALVPVQNVPMLERVMKKLKDEGFGKQTVNIHHFGEQIMDFLSSRDFGVVYNVSDERERLLDTGGGILKASEILMREDKEPFLVHNVDILSDAPLRSLYEHHCESGNDVTLLTSGRDSSRKLVFDGDGILRGWHNLASGEFRPEGFSPEEGMHESSFSGIYIIGEGGIEEMRAYACKKGDKAFPVMDFLLDTKEIKIGEYFLPRLNLIDIGKPSTLEQANYLMQIND
ncbi:MAG: NTP transferase domain-containing protein [Muribaculaceae bacterium]|nr:NTP transferase domain-containing protein [Muribaculaceae bacterium]